MAFLWPRIPRDSRVVWGQRLSARGSTQRRATCQTESSSAQAAQNLIVLAREEPGAEKIFQSDGVRLLLQLLDTGRLDMILAAVRTLAGLCQGHRSRVSVY